IIFVTHSLDEAVFLGNRVLAMTPGGIGITAELNIDLPRPRDPMSIEFANLKRKLFSMLTAHLDAPTNTFSE
ncbi:MAG: ABC transporter ATP-binding protein, partial [Pseudolabrys sp.]